jgi:putative transposase
VTLIREPDGRYYASFVVDRAPAPLPASEHEVGVDVGLDRLVVTSGREIIANPRFLRARQRRLAMAQRAMSRKQKGSANRAKAGHRVAVLHRKVRETRRDHAHKIALWLIRENQAVYAEDLAVSGLARGWLAKSVHDAGCGAVHDRDINAARNILAAGRAERLNACGGNLRPPPTVAVPGEAGTHRGAA